MNLGRDVNPLFVTTTPIRTKDNQDGGTGYFLNYLGRTYVVTNRHVIEPEGEKINEARIWLRDFDDIRNTTHLDLSLSGGDGEDWFGHYFGSDIDLAVIPIGPKLSDLDDAENQTHVTGSLAFTADHFIHRNIGVGSQVSIIGYPGNIVDSSGRFPIRRNALIATPYGHSFDGKLYFLTDAQMHEGTSGSPVVLQSDFVRRMNGPVPEERQKPVYLLGTHSATIPRNNLESRESIGWKIGPGRRIDSGQRDNYGLNLAWYPGTLEDILWRVTIHPHLTDEEKQLLDEMNRSQLVAIRNRLWKGEPDDHPVRDLMERVREEG